MRVISQQEVYERVKAAILQMNVVLPDDVKSRLQAAYDSEHGLGKQVLGRILENIDTAESQCMPMCQDTGMVLAFLEVGTGVQVDGCLCDALSRAIGDAYEEGNFRKSVVNDPLERENTGTNVPPVVYREDVPGECMRIGLLAKGFGSENCSRTYMLKPTEGRDRIRDVVCDTVQRAGGAPCPPVVLGVGIGGTMDYAAVLSKKALLEPLGTAHDADTEALEQELLSAVNALNIGPGGLGGATTALGVAVRRYPTHIAGLPVAVSVNCWADRKAIVRM